MSIDSDHVNYLIYRYLQESGKRSVSVCLLFVVVVVELALPRLLSFFFFFFFASFLGFPSSLILFIFSSFRLLDCVQVTSTVRLPLLRRAG